MSYSSISQNFVEKSFFFLELFQKNTKGVILKPRLRFFRVNWKKVVYPTQRLIFSGVLLDTVRCSMSLPDVKLLALKSYLLEFSLRGRASKRHFQVLAWKLNWACSVVYGGRTFLRRILDFMNQLNSPNAKIKLNTEFYADLFW